MVNASFRLSLDIGVIHNYPKISFGTWRFVLGAT